LALKTAFMALDRFRQTSSVGGTSVTEQTAVAVTPQRPPTPSLLTIETAAPMRAMALRNTARRVSVVSIIPSEIECLRTDHATGPAHSGRHCYADAARASRLDRNRTNTDSPVRSFFRAFPNPAHASGTACEPRRDCPRN